MEQVPLFIRKYYRISGWRNTPIKKSYIYVYPIYSTLIPLLALTLFQIYLGVIMIKTEFLELHDIPLPQ